MDEIYNKLLNRWKGKIENLEKCCSDSKKFLNTDTQARLFNQLEYLKSYFYSAKYFATNPEKDSDKILKELITEMKKLEFEIRSELRTK